jgi:hypothetical protein
MENFSPAGKDDSAFMMPLPTRARQSLPRIPHPASLVGAAPTDPHNLPMSLKHAAERVVAGAGNPDATQDEIILWAKQFFTAARQAPPPEVAEALEALCRGIELPDGERAVFVATCCGALVEQGTDPAPMIGPMLARLAQTPNRPRPGSPAVRRVNRRILEPPHLSRSAPEREVSGPQRSDGHRVLDLERRLARGHTEVRRPSRHPHGPPELSPRMEITACLRRTASRVLS